MGKDEEPVARSRKVFERSFRLLVTGGRLVSSREVVFGVLDAADARRPIDYVMHRGSEGAEALAGEWARERRRPWEIMMKTRQGPQGARAGDAEELLAVARPDGVIAFPGGRFTRRVVQLARAQGVAVWLPLGP